MNGQTMSERNMLAQKPKSFNPVIKPNGISTYKIGLDVEPSGQDKYGETKKHMAIRDLDPDITQTGLSWQQL